MHCKNSDGKCEVCARHDNVNHPKHYTSHPSGVECITICEHFNFNLGNVIKYVWRSGLKDSVLENLLKARVYLNREIDRIEADLSKTQIYRVSTEHGKGMVHYSETTVWSEGAKASTGEQAKASTGEQAKGGTYPKVKE